MNSKHSLPLLFLFLVVLIAPNPDVIFADHGSGGGGGGCSGDCTPPTLGQDKDGRVYVKEGISINDDSFDVSYFEQDIPTQSVKVGEPVVINLKIYENTGPRYLTHVFLMLGLEEKVISGVTVPSHSVQIVWEQTSDGVFSVSVDDPDSLVSDVDVEYSLTEDVFENEDNLTNLQFKFTPIQKFNTDTILVKAWDYKNNSWTNYFYGAMLIDDDRIESEKILNNDEIPNNNESTINIPEWFKTNTGFWSEDKIDDATFITGIKYLIEQKIINIPNIQTFEPEPLLHFIDTKKGAQHYLDRYYSDEIYRDWFDSNFPEYSIEEAVGIPSDPTIPDWIKTNASHWTDNLITDKEFVGGIEFLIKNGIILF